MSRTTVEPSDLLEEIKRLAEDFETHAATTDRAGPANRSLRRNIKLLAKSGFFGAGISTSSGGRGLGDEEIRRCHELLASACGATAFTQHQFHAGGTYVTKARNDELKDYLLPQFALGELICGVAFSHLRRPGPPAVVATPSKTGYRVTGEAPWVTGWRMLDAFILGAVSSLDNRIVYFYVPVTGLNGVLEPSAPIRLSSMDAGDTVRVRFDNLQLPDQYLLFERDAEYMVRSDYRSIASHVWLPLGCAEGSARALQELAVDTGRQSLLDAANRLTTRIEVCRENSLTWSAGRADEPDYRKHALAARTEAIMLALNAAEAHIVACGGSAHLQDHPAQRRLREAAFYATSAQTPDIQSTFLEAVTIG